MLPNCEGQRISEVTFRTHKGDQWVNGTTPDLYQWQNSCCVCFAGCSSTHLPDYNELPPLFRELCIAVNDYPIAYGLNVYTRNWKELHYSLSKLPQNLQEACNEAGIEIMSRSYLALRDGNTSTIPNK
ncbi:hypothetical protein [Thermosynechococcus vestitus]|uniref:Tll0815 protein n=1 Tax=Thermosynechococcus vestitus (strain NIES-2133 / IAM M-273 / BP-1) TaxID=197221 RepID=Q8DKP4_THEVB|nr:hypothetical protein [Thermosynechococcus vestitus]BAC08366.1 tll0815 [Thermosynechococcus vestitus BP-1]